MLKIHENKVVSQFIFRLNKFQISVKEALHSLNSNTPQNIYCRIAQAYYSTSIFDDLIPEKN